MSTSSPLSIPFESGAGVEGRLSRFQILDVLSSRERTELYRARDTEHNRIVAIKVLAPDCGRDPVVRRGLLEAARTASALSHSNVASVLEGGEDRDHLFLVSEFVAGKSLTTLLEERHLSSRRAIDLAWQIADAAAEAHALGIVHGDLTPDHVIVTPGGSAKVLKFGLASWTRCARACSPFDSSEPGSDWPARSDDAASHEPTDADFLIDVAAIGALLLEMTSERGTSGSTARRRLAGAGGTLTLSVDPDVPSELNAVLRGALAAGSSAGCGSAAALAAELAAVAAILDVRSKASASERTTASWRHQ